MFTRSPRRSGDQNLLALPLTTFAFERRAPNYSASLVWNDFTSSIRSCQTSHLFKSCLKPVYLTLTLRMLILENLISPFENKNSRDLVENSSRIGITRLTLGFGRCTHRTSKIGNIRACRNIGESASASHRCRCYKNKICRPRHQRWRRCGGGE